MSHLANVWLHNNFIVRLVCTGTSLHLKSRYGVGYYLTLVKQQPSQQQQQQQQQQERQPQEFDSVAQACGDKKESVTCSLNSIDDAEDEGISDISTHETIINPSEANEK